MSTIYRLNTSPRLTKQERRMKAVKRLDQLSRDPGQCPIANCSQYVFPSGLMSHLRRYHVRNPHLVFRSAYESKPIRMKLPDPRGFGECDMPKCIGVLQFGGIYKHPKTAPGHHYLCVPNSDLDQDHQKYKNYLPMMIMVSKSSWHDILPSARMRYTKEQRKKTEGSQNDGSGLLVIWLASPATVKPFHYTITFFNGSYNNSISMIRKSRNFVDSQIPSNFLFEKNDFVILRDLDIQLLLERPKEKGDQARGIQMEIIVHELLSGSLLTQLGYQTTCTEECNTVEVEIPIVFDKEEDTKDAEDAQADVDADAKQDGASPTDSDGSSHTVTNSVVALESEQPVRAQRTGTKIATESEVPPGTMAGAGSNPKTDTATEEKATTQPKATKTMVPTTSKYAPESKAESGTKPAAESKVPTGTRSKSVTEGRATAGAMASTKSKATRSYITTKTILPNTSKNAPECKAETGTKPAAEPKFATGTGSSPASRSKSVAEGRAKTGLMASTKPKATRYISTKTMVANTSKDAPDAKAEAGTKPATESMVSRGTTVGTGSSPASRSKSVAEGRATTGAKASTKSKETRYISTKTMVANTSKDAPDAKAEAGTKPATESMVSRGTTVGTGSKAITEGRATTGAKASTKSKATKTVVATKSKEVTEPKAETGTKTTTGPKTEIKASPMPIQSDVESETDSELKIDNLLKRFGCETNTGSSNLLAGCNDLQSATGAKTEMPDNPMLTSESDTESEPDDYAILVRLGYDIGSESSVSSSSLSDVSSGSSI
ncbi:agglutinin-like protein 5 [Drosophila pseudoobscura]|uniref:Agglutinin-like protein 5 n=1 Tax=Drosophila pseudoobscura pseudoobscura TaxID=46245 RepID=A0A6I8W624_DROPS|nr:agglutinin-like protein 5 [Drosophila pseudoobscura]